LSDYKQPMQHGPGTGPMYVNDMPLKLTPRLKRCSRCNTDREPQGGCQVTVDKWVCGKCWRPSLHTQRLKSKSKAVTAPAA